MASLQFLPPSFTHNPIMQAELAYQKRQSGRRRWWSYWLTRVVLVSAVMLAFILYGGEFMGALLSRDPTPIGERFSVGVALLIVFTLVLHFVLIFRALVLSANSITREKQSKTWDMLVLTGVDAQQIVLGKWWATVQRLWRWYVLLGALRACVLVWISASTSRATHMFYASSGSYYYSWSGVTVPHPIQILLAGVLVMALTLANLALTAACGLSVSGDSRSSAMALIRAIMARGVTLVMAALLLLWLSSLLSLSFGILNEFPYRVGLTLLDNGATLAGELSSYRSVYFLGSATDMTVPAAVLSLGAYALLTLALLQTAQRRAIRQQALTPAR